MRGGDIIFEGSALREDADYYGRWTKEDSKKLLRAAGDFLRQADNIISEKR